MRWACLSAVVVAGVLAGGVARAELPAEGADEVRWRREWPRFRVVEVVGTVALVGGAVAARYVPEAPPARWTGGLLFDDAVRDGLRLSTGRSQRAAGFVSDVLWWTSMGWPLLVDPLLFAAAVHGEGDVALQLAAIALEHLTLSAFLATLSENIGRQRPRGQGCDGSEAGSEYCRSGEANRSFLSGHALASFAGAGLTCTAHGKLPLYGGGAPEVAACVAALGVASGSAILRIASDNHWASDVLISSGLGLAIGTLLPRALHFGLGRAGVPGAPTSARVVPLVGGEVQGLALALE